MNVRDDSNWVMISDAQIECEPFAQWVITPDCGASVVFAGTARDHSPRSVAADGAEIDPTTDVTHLVYEAYDEVALDRLGRVITSVRERFPRVRRIAMAHRVGTVRVSEVAVVVAVASPHRADAFGAASFGIDELKRTLPVWKKEVWGGGEAWSQLGDLGADVIVEGAVPDAKNLSQRDGDLLSVSASAPASSHGLESHARTFDLGGRSGT